jgi:branched-chain amino acid transport system substrate-binding protein
MAMHRRNLLAAGASVGGFAGFTRRARAQAANTVKLGGIVDLSGMYRDVAGPVVIAAARQAVQDFGPRGFNVEVLSADQQNKPDVGVNVARQWFDRDGVDCLIDVSTSSVALAVNDIAREKN